jgi:hypothetical protein
MVDKASVISTFSEESADLSPGFWHGPVPDDLGVLGHRSYSFLTHHVSQALYLAFEEFKSCLSKCFQDRLQRDKMLRQISTVNTGIVQIWQSHTVRDTL